MPHTDPVYSPEDWQIGFDLIDQMLELPEPDRARWLANLGAEYAPLKPMLRDMLASRGVIAKKGFLNSLPDFDDIDADADADSKADKNSALLGSLVGPYRLIRQIGVGGMGTVWLAERADGSVKRPVALKLPFAGPLQQQLVERFLRERDILARLTHKNIARLYDAGTIENAAQAVHAAHISQPYFAMEYIDGIPINEYCDMHELTIAQRLQLFRQVLSAVQYAHSNLVLHRDLKPNNILVNGEGTVSLLDFGIAKVMEDNLAKETELTVAGGGVLTPDYASPEQITGDTLSTASDVYSLGVILYELLAGTRPYKLKRGTRGELEDAIALADVLRPSQRARDTSTASTASTYSVRTRTTAARKLSSISASTPTPVPTQLNLTTQPAAKALAAEQRQTTPKKLSQSLEGDLDTIILKALKKNPADRYATVAALDEDIMRHLRGDTVLARPDSRWYRIQKFVARNKAATLSVCAVILALTAGMGIALWQAEKARREAEYSNARALFWAELFTTNVPRNHLAAMPSARDVLQNGEAVIKQYYSARPDIAAKIYADLGRATRGAGDYPSALLLYEKGLAKTEEAFGDMSPQARDIRLGLTTRYLWGMQLARFFSLEPKVRNDCVTTYDFKSENCIRYADARAQANLFGGKLLQAEQQMTDDLMRIGEGGKLGSKDYKFGVPNVLRGLRSKSEIVRGDVLAGRPGALSTLENVTYPPLAQCYQCLYYAGQLMTASGDIAHAANYVSQYLDRHDAGRGEHRYGSNDLLRSAARIFSLMGEHDRAERLYQRTVDASMLKFGPDNIDLAFSLREQGYAYILSAKFDEARIALQEAIRIHALLGSDENHWLSEAKIALAGVDVMQGKAVEAREILRAEQQIAIKNKDDANLSFSLYWLAKISAKNVAQNAAGIDEAIKNATESLAIMSRGGRGRTPLALAANLLMVEHAPSVALKQKYAARSLVIARYMYGADHPRTIAIAQKFAAANMTGLDAISDPFEAAIDLKIDAQDADIKRYVTRVSAALATTKNDSLFVPYE